LSDGSTELMRVTYSAEKPTLKTDDHKIVLKHAQTTAPDMLVRLTSVGVKANPWKIGPISTNRLTTSAKG
jgi:hypothetical protein